MTGQAFDLVKFRIHKRQYSQLRAIISELGESDTMLLRALASLHDIHINTFTDDPELYFTEDTHQLGLLREQAVPSPTMLQLALTSKSFSTTEEGAKERWYKAMEEFR